MPGPEVRVFEQPSDLATEAAEFLVWLSQQRLTHRSSFHVALSGGSTPTALYQRLATNYAMHVNWPQVEWYFGDERCVPADHPDSNYRMAHQALLGPLRVPADRIFPMDGGNPNPYKAAEQYEEIIRRRVPADASGWPRFDLILLGLGDDGHTASLFPGSPALKVHDRAVVATEASRGVRRRLTLTVPVLNHARTVLFLVTGAEKAAAVFHVLEDPRADPLDYPAKFVAPREGRLLWYLDRSAAGRLSGTRQQLVFDEE